MDPKESKENIKTKKSRTVKNLKSLMIEQISEHFFSRYFLRTSQELQLFLSAKNSPSDMHRRGRWMFPMSNRPTVQNLIHVAGEREEKERKTLMKSIES